MGSFKGDVIMLIVILCLGIGVGFLGTKLISWPSAGDIRECDAWRNRTYLLFCKLAECEGDDMDELWPGLNCDSAFAIRDYRW